MHEITHLSNKMHTNVMFKKLLNYALKVVRLDRALNRTPLACESNTTDMAMPLRGKKRNN